MRRCPVCEKELAQGLVCDNCGFDLSRNYERNRTLCPALPGHAEPVSVRTAKWKRQQGQAIPVSPSGLVCPKCGGKQFLFLVDEMQFLCADCETKIPVVALKNEPVWESDSSVEEETADATDDPPVIEETDTLPDADKTPKQKTAKEPSGSDGPGPGGPVPEPSVRTGQGDSGILLICFWYFLAASVGLALLSWLILDRGWSLVAYVPGMLLDAVFYAVSAAFVFRCRRRIREVPDAGQADGVGRTAVFFGTLIKYHVMLTLFQQAFVVWNTSDRFSLLPMMLNAGIYVTIAVYIFRCRRRIKEMLDAGLTGQVRRTAVLFGTLILIRVLLDIINQFIL